MSVTFKTSTWLSVLGEGVSCADFGRAAEQGTGHLRAQFWDRAPQLCLSRCAGPCCRSPRSSLGIEMLHVVYSSFHSAVCNFTESLRLRTETTAFHWLITDPLLGGFLFWFCFCCCCLFDCGFFCFIFFECLFFFPMVVFKIVLNHHKREG